MPKTIIAIGGGEIKNKETLGIDEYIANLAKSRAGERRACGLFIPTASHDFMPYYNSFHKVYTGVFDIKTDVALSVFKEFDSEKMRA
ncbi:MAG: Type 1 glutamine amidotransferase-like domain-containing protein, partial [Clostridia bacterium]|nr:Type 1 glutamine amidotransferase-like domain-containing protein [Clostridia bacterium]